MIAVHLLSPDKVAEELVKLGCRFLEELDQGHDLWITSWNFIFTVPKIGEDKWCPKYVLFEIMSDVEKCRPHNHPRNND